jgi:hypothetical protein
MKDRAFWFVVVSILLQPPFGVRAEQSSAADAKRLCEAMAAGHLDAIAARGTNGSDRFVAALFYPNAELLVISARYAAPQALQQLLDQKKYAQVYSILQTSPDASDQVFFIDMMADGLSAEARDGADVMYEPGNKQTVFDESWRKEHRLGAREYLSKFETADTLYAALLKTLTGIAQATTTSR